MKKIVALVLSLVMALSLCTVAFGASTCYFTKGQIDKKDFTTSNGGIELKKVAAKTFTDGHGWVEYYVNEDTDTVYVPCDKGDTGCEGAVYFGRGFGKWVRVADRAAAEFKFAVTEQKATDKKATCDKAHFLDDGYLDADGNFYVEADDAFRGAESYAVKFDGKVITVYDAFIGYECNYVPASHIFGEPKANDKTGYDEVTCLVCKGVFAATNDEAVLAKNKVNQKATFAYFVFDAEQVFEDNDYSWAWGDKFADDYEYVWSLKAGTASTDKDGVNSAKTFDAGIAMYVGMSLLSVAGGAVVIGKKKEF